MSLQQNDWVHGYRLLAPLGSGGFGDVWRAADRAGNVVAIKLLHATLDAQAKRRFANEARIITRLSHPHCVAAIDFGELPTGQMFLVTELLEGVTLDVWAHTTPPVEARRTVAVQVAQALAAAHAQGVIHRDLKPNNIIVRDTAHGPHATVLDFGIAKMTGEFGGDVTETGEVIGTPQYMSPEQFRDAKSVTNASDVYSLGVVLYELFEQRPLFRGALIDVALQHMRQPPPPMKRASVDLEQLLLTMLAKDPAARPPTMNAVIEQLTQVNLAVAEEVLTRSRPRPAFVASTPEQPTPRRVNRQAIAALLGVVAVIAIAAVAVSTSSPTREPAPAIASQTRANPFSAPAPVHAAAAQSGDDAGRGEDAGDSTEDVTTPPVRDNPTTSGAGCERRLPIEDVSLPVEHYAIPRSYTPGEPMPYVIVFHDAGQEPSHLASYTSLLELADRDGVILLFPKSQVRGPLPTQMFAPWNDRDERTDIEVMVTEVADELCLDTSRVGVLGFGVGGKLVQRLNCSNASLHPPRAVTVNHQNKDERYSHCDDGDGDGDPVAALLSIHSETDTVLSGECETGERYIAQPDAIERLRQFYRCADAHADLLDVPDGWRCEVSDACALPLTVCVQPEGRYWTTLPPAGAVRALARLQPWCITTSRPEPDYVWQFLTDWD